MSILVLGLGNILLTDEGVGVHVVESLLERYIVPDGVDVVDGGTSGMDMLDMMTDRDHIVIVDAVRTGAPPATVVRLAEDEVPAFFRTKISPHQLGLSDVLATLTIMDKEPGGITLIGVVPVDMGTALALSPAITEKVPEMVDLVVAELAALGAPPEPRFAAVAAG